MRAGVILPSGAVGFLGASAGALAGAVAASLDDGSCVPCCGGDEPTLPGNECCRCWASPVAESSLGPAQPPLGRYLTPRSELSGTVTMQYSVLDETQFIAGTNAGKKQSLETFRTASASLWSGLRPSGLQFRCDDWGRIEGAVIGDSTFGAPQGRFHFTTRVIDEIRPDNNGEELQQSRYIQTTNVARLNVFGLSGGGYSSPIVRPYDTPTSTGSTGRRELGGGPNGRAAAANRNEMAHSFTFGVTGLAPKEALSVVATDPVIDGQGPIWDVVGQWDQWPSGFPPGFPAAIAPAPTITVNVTHSSRSRSFAQMRVEVEYRRQFDLTVGSPFQDYRVRRKLDVVYTLVMFARADVWACVPAGRGVQSGGGVVDRFGVPYEIDPAFDAGVEALALRQGGCCGSPSS